MKWEGGCIKEYFRQVTPSRRSDFMRSTMRQCMIVRDGLVLGRGYISDSCWEFGEISKEFSSGR